MKIKSLLIGVLGGLCLNLGAQAQPAPGSPGVYSIVGRANDPFVFCTYGVPMHGWVAVNPMTGAWKPISKYVNYQWVGVYTSICPMAFGVGPWTGPGTGQESAANPTLTPPLVPFPH